MHLTWKDGLATGFIGLAVVLFAVWSAGGTVAGISGRGLVVAMLGQFQDNPTRPDGASRPFLAGPSWSVPLAWGWIFLLGIAGCYTAQSHFETVYGVNGTTRPPLAYVVLVSAVGGLATVAGIVAMIVGGTAAVATLLLAMVVMWMLSTVRHQRRASAVQSAATGH